MRKFILIFAIFFLLAGKSDAVDKKKLRWARNHPQIDSIHIEGNSQINRGEIKKVLYSKRRNLWLKIKGDRRSRVQRETRGKDTLEVKYLYLSLGFLSVAVDHSFEPLSVDSNAMVVININEGKQFYYGTKSVTGKFDGSFTHKFKELVGNLNEGDPVNPFDLNAIELEIHGYLANRGYPYARVRYSVDTISNPDRCPIAFDILSDSIVHFGAVAIEGALNYPEYISRRELKIKQGTVYRLDDIRESQRRLFESGYFSTFQLREADSVTDRLNPNFVLKLRERKRRYLTLKTGAGQSEVRDLLWDISAGFGQRDFLGSRRYDLLADYSFSAGSDHRLIVHRYRLRFTEPWLLGIRMPMSFTYQWKPTTLDPVQEFKKREWSLSAVVTKWFGRSVRLIFGGEYQNLKISGASDEIIVLARTLEGNSARRKLYASFRRDSRDNLFLPQRGSVTELGGDYFGGFLGGDADFFRIQAGWSRYRKIWPGWLAASRIKVGWAEEFGKTEKVPLDEALYLGGANTIRGFEENKLGPLLDDGTPEGARYTFVFNQEFRWKTVQLLNKVPFIGSLFEKFPLWQSVFVDIGNGFRNKDELLLSNLAIAYGTGIQIVSPAGPIRIDYAQVLETDRFDFAHRWHFTILYAF